MEWWDWGSLGDPWHLCAPALVSPRFATQERDGLLLYNGRFNERHDFVALEIVDEQLQLTFSAGTYCPCHTLALHPCTLVGTVSFTASLTSSQTSHSVTAWDCILGIPFPALHHLLHSSLHPWPAILGTDGHCIPGIPPLTLHPWHCILDIPLLPLHPLRYVPNTASLALNPWASHSWHCRPSLSLIVVP